MEEILLGLTNILILFYLIIISRSMPRKTKMNASAPNTSITEIREAVLK